MTTEPGFYANNTCQAIASIELRVCGSDTFQVMTPFVCRDRSGKTHDVPANTNKDTTDLASVPPWLWGLIASYGHQLAPALLHDHLCAQARQTAATGERSTAYKDRRSTDRLFHEALRVADVRWFRALVFWAAVTLDRYKSFRKPLWVTYVLQALVSTIGVWAAASVWFWRWARPTHHSSWFAEPSSWLYIGAGAAVLSVLYGWDSMAAIFVGCVVAPLVVALLLINFAGSLLLAFPDAVYFLGQAIARIWNKDIKLRPPTVKPTRVRLF